MLHRPQRRVGCSSLEMLVTTSKRCPCPCCRRVLAHAVEVPSSHMFRWSSVSLLAEYRIMSKWSLRLMLCSGSSRLFGRLPLSVVLEGQPCEAILIGAKRAHLLVRCERGLERRTGFSKPCLTGLLRAVGCQRLRSGHTKVLARVHPLRWLVGSDIRWDVELLALHSSLGCDCLLNSETVNRLPPSAG